jgi:hypothetical protein
MTHGGNGFTTTVVEHVLVQFCAFVTVTVYVGVVVGLTVIEDVVAPVLQRNDVPPDTESVDEPPIQIASSETVMVHGGNGFTVIVIEHELVQPLASVTVTV